MKASLAAASGTALAAMILVAACTPRTTAPADTAAVTATAGATAAAQAAPPTGTTGATGATTRTTGAAPVSATSPGVLTGVDITEHAYLTGDYTSEGVDENGDGLFETLMLHVGLEVRTAGTYLVNAVLADQDGEFLTYGSTQMDIGPGRASMPVKFPAGAVRAFDKPGPYGVKSVDLILNDADGQAVARQRVADVYQTEAFRLDQLAPPALEILGPVSDRVLDLDGDSVNDAVGVDVEVSVTEEGDYALTAFLNSSSFRHFVFSDEPAVTLQPGRHTLTLAFSSLQIQAFNAEGRFDLDKLLAHRVVAGRSERIDSWAGTYQTQAYMLSQFPTPTD